MAVPKTTELYVGVGMAVCRQGMTTQEAPSLHHFFKHAIVQWAVL